MLDLGSECLKTRQQCTLPATKRELKPPHAAQIPLISSQLIKMANIELHVAQMCQGNGEATWISTERRSSGSRKVLSDLLHHPLKPELSKPEQTSY